MKNNLFYLFLIILMASVPGIILAQDHSYDIKKYDIVIKPDFNSKNLTLEAIITIDNPKLEKTFIFGLNENYTKIKVNSRNVPAKFEFNNGWITVNVANPLKSMVLSFTLEGKPGKSIDENRDVIENESLFLLWSDRFYPIDFGDWALAKTTIILPKTFQAIAPGKLVSAIKGKSNIKYIFESSVPDANYSVFADTRWIKTEKVINGIKMQTLHYPECQKYSEQIFKSSSNVLQFFSETLCNYPFEQFSFITISGMYARRAFSGFIGYTPAYLEKEFSTTGFDAHETSLLWWGHIITGSGDGGWQWMEGFGDYSEVYYDLINNKPLPKIFQFFRAKYLASDFEKDPLYFELRGNTSQEFIHGKYPWLMHFLRYRLGDENFNKAISYLFKTYKFHSVSIDEFIAALENGSGQSLKWFRDEWLERRGVPILSFNYKVLGSDHLYKIIGVIEQKGNMYDLPLEVGIQTENEMIIKKINIKEKETKFNFELVYKPSKVILDPNDWVIMKRTDN
jgi:aminopeptidase N